MRRLPTLIAVVLLSITITAQNGDMDADIEQVQSTVGRLVGPNAKADFLFRDLSLLSGTAGDLEEESFKIYPGKKKAGGLKVQYANVLAISSKLASISLVPDPTAKPFGSWQVLSSLPVNRDIEIRLKDGVEHKGRFRKANADEMVIADAVSGSDVVLKRDQVTSIFVVRYGARQLGGTAAGASQKGGRIGREIGTGRGKGFAEALGAGIGALAGIIKGAATKSETLKVLIFSQ